MNGKLTDVIFMIYQSVDPVSVEFREPVDEDRWAVYLDVF